MSDKNKSTKEAAINIEKIKKIIQADLESVMTPDPVSVGVNEAFEVIPKKFNDFNIRHLPVVDKYKRVIGLITQRDLYKIQSPRKLIDGSYHYDKDLLSDIILKHVMNKKVICMKKKDSLAEAIIKLTKSKNGCLPVVDDDRVLCGIFTRQDALRVSAALFTLLK